jgi:FMN phosphatase YigB (HAD superfamily)
MSSRRVWLFDLDNTLHDANPHIFPAISRAMGEYVAQKVGVGETAAKELRDHYWRRCILVEDTAANLRAAKQLGMKTVLVSPTAQAPTYVDVLIKSVLELPRLGLTK